MARSVERRVNEREDRMRRMEMEIEEKKSERKRKRDANAVEFFHIVAKNE